MERCPVGGGLTGERGRGLHLEVVTAGLGGLALAAEKEGEAKSSTIGVSDSFHAWKTRWGDLTFCICLEDILDTEGDSWLQDGFPSVWFRGFAGSSRRSVCTLISTRRTGVIDGEVALLERTEQVMIESRRLCRQEKRGERAGGSSEICQNASTGYRPLS